MSVDLLLTGATVYDGTGAPPQQIDVGIRDGRLVLDLPADARSSATRVRDLTGLSLCPGFVDIHTHSDLTVLSNPLGDSKIRQGVTTEVVGNCGLGVVPVPPLPATGATLDPQPGADLSGIRAAVGYLDLDPAIDWSWTDLAGYLDALRAAQPAMNVAALVPHLPLHASVVGFADTPATEAQIDRIVELLDLAFAQGAVGVSTGLVYAPLCYVNDDELLAIGRVAARRGRVFAWHVRDYTDSLIESVEQAVRVARATGCRVQISHLQVVGRRNWGKVRDALAIVDAANADGCDVGVDMYPYLAGNAPLSQLLPYWAQAGGAEVFAPTLRDATVRQRVAEFWLGEDRQWSEIVVNGVSGNSELAPIAGQPVVGRNIADLAADLGVEPADVALDLLAEHGSAVTIIAFGRDEKDLDTVLAHPATVVASDGQALDPVGATGLAGSPHPRSYGCFPRYLARYAADLADGIRRCTSAPAARVGISDRGRIAEGLVADLVVFNPSTLADQATFTQPQQFPIGIELVLVGGQIVVDHGIDTGARPGVVLTASADGQATNEGDER